ncbi:TPA: hypothetical protein I8438_000736 [Serratia marcescens]|uniref:Apea-like HEPN domain-containing protein n=1 Tax=Serratia marcescens TaxID=615 RepID=A0AB33FQ37_SERMA|nr:MULTISPECIES: hypothetical protein [Serratia]AWL66863.1 hypothetical protein DKC05_03845 [Serratia marcescens]MDP8873528.1 hypothetical protein [Serratia marcescens]UBI64641.1 hypothetical protein GF111_01730 [Serratia sp. HRI]HAT2209027.1 hypothetical protein [Serratia marcescens]HAT2220300.1 hypothetical protein [Serratia marcescens]
MKLEDALKNKQLICSLFAQAKVVDDEIESESAAIIASVSGSICINGYIAIAVYDMDSSINIDEDIIIHDVSGGEVGYLCPTRSINHPVSINQLTENRLVCLISDIEPSELGKSDMHRFNCDYLLIKSDFFEEYNNRYKESSVIWGGFSHKKNSESQYKRQVSSINLREGIFSPTLRHGVDLQRAVKSSNGFDRYLKYYHQLELLFDVVFVSKIKSLPVDSLQGFGDIFKDMHKKEIEIFKGMLREYVVNTESLLGVISANMKSSFIPTMTSIFQDHSKEGNPLLGKDRSSDKWNGFMTFITGNDLSARSAKVNKLISQEQSDLLKEFVINLVSYWLYRIRCSIAHNRIGEFLFDNTHEEFVVEIGERMIKEVIGQIFSNVKLKNILDNT